MAEVTARRRSSRLAALDPKQEPEDTAIKPAPKSTKKRKTTTKKDKSESDPPQKKKTTTKAAKIAESVLPRTREEEIKHEFSPQVWVMGIDEAGRGPLAGPVVAAAAVVPAEIEGITDSKKITSEDTREKLYEVIIASPDVSWAVAVVDAQRIDEINILQATMQAMSMAAAALVCDSPESESKWKEMANAPASVSRSGCYVACGGKMLKAKPSSAEHDKVPVSEDKPDCTSTSYYALVDGNRIPVDLPCQGESIVKGDSKEYSIGAASILAKVTRDRLMHAYDKIYPQYNLAKHKGYPTREHMAAVFEFGASPIHRRSFAPLKHMTFDENGKIVDETTN